MFLLGESTKKRSISCLLFFSLLKLSEEEEVKGNISSSFVKATDVKEHAYELYVNLKCFFLQKSPPVSIRLSKSKVKSEEAFS